ncbi:MAG: hypothetical protein IJU23_09405 [Proteobacteria bacterium]|nr:hypothetical protein [Pseudomonadota bacterium]
MSQPKMTIQELRLQNKCTSNSFKANEVFHTNSAGFSGKKVLYVEGPTDELFVKKLALEQKIKIKVYSSNDDENTQHFYDSRQSFCPTSPIRTLHPNSKPAQKEAIIHLAENHRGTNYGLVDLDFDFELKCYGHLFVTDTHDIETLMLSTDLDLMNKLDIDSDCLKKAYFMAYQLGIVRFVMHKNKCKSCLNQYSNLAALFDESSYKLSLDKLCSHMENNCNPQYIPQIIEELSIGDFFENGEWSCSLSEFDHDNADFWRIVNGHDILTLVCCLQPQIDQKYHRIQPDAPHIRNRKPDRKFETDLITHYDYDCVSNTDVYRAIHKQLIAA